MNKAALLFSLLMLPAAAVAEDTTPSETIVVEGKQQRPTKPQLTPKFPEYSLQTQRFDFPTGLRIYMQSDATHPIASVYTVVDHGSGDDPDGAEGTAHFCEHLWFRSSHENFGPEFSDKPIMSVINDMGAQFNATTWSDLTDYRTVASKEFLPLMLKMESARLTAPYRNVSADVIPTEREVIRNEWRRRNEQGSALLWDYLTALTFPEGHPYHDSSTHESLDNVELEVLQKYFDDYYHPQNTTITVIGDFNPKEAASLIFENFDPKLLHPDLTEDDVFFCPRPGIEKPDKDNEDHWWTCATQPGTDGKELFQFSQAPEPRLTEERLPDVTHRTKEPTYKEAVLGEKVKYTVAIAWPMPGGFRADDAIFNVAGSLVQGAIYSGYVLNEDVRKKLEFGGCGYQAFKHHGLGICLVDIKSSSLKPENVAEKMLDQLARLQLLENTGTDYAQFERANWNYTQQAALASTILDIDTVVAVFGGRAERIGQHAHYAGRAQYYSDTMNNVMALQREKGREAALKYFTRDKASILILEPLKEDEIDKSGEKSTYAGGSSGDSAMGGGEFYEKLTVQEIEDSYYSPAMEKLVDAKLPNGMRLVFMPHSQAPIVQASLVFGGGPSFGPYGRYSFFNTFSDWEEEDILKIAGGRSLYSTGTEFGLGYRVPAGNLDGAFWFLREYVDGVMPDTEGKTSWLKSNKSGIKKGWADKGWHAGNMRSEYLYADHFAGRSREWGDLDVWGSWGSEDIREYIKGHVHPENTVLLVVGNLDVDEAKSLAIKYFSGWEGKGEAELESLADLTAPPMPSGKRVLLFDDPKATQTDTRQYCRLNTADGKDTYGVDVLSDLVFTRVFTQLRVREGLAYSPGGFASMGDKYGMMGFRSLAVNLGVGRTLEFFDEAIREMENGEFDDGVLAQAKLRQARSAGVLGQSTNQMMQKLMNVIESEGSWDTIPKTGAEYAAVSKDQLQRLTKGCSENSIITLIGPKDVLAPQLKEKGIEFEVVDWEKRGDAFLAKHDPKAAKKKAKSKAKADKKKAKKEAKEKAKAAKAGTAPEADGEKSEGEGDAPATEEAAPAADEATPAAEEGTPAPAEETTPEEKTE
jgi:zinc protease